MKPKRPRPTLLEFLAAAAIMLALFLLCTVSQWLPWLSGLSPTMVKVVFTGMGGLITFPIMLFAFRRVIEGLPVGRVILIMLGSLAIVLAWAATGSDWILLAFVVVSLGIAVWRLSSNPLLPLALSPAVSQLRQGDKVKALATVGEYLRTHPDQWQALQLRAVIELSMMNLPEAERDARRVVQLAPKQEGGYSTLGNVNLVQGLYQRAKDNFERALRLKPNSSNTNYNYGLGCYRLGDYSTALGAFRVVAKKGGVPDENMLLTNFYLAKCCEATGDTASAAAAYEQLKRHRAGYERLLAENSKLPDYEGVVVMRGELDEMGKLIG
jgi:tetratricopeptide (TPR) repeat protein